MTRVYRFLPLLLIFSVAVSLSAQEIGKVTFKQESQYHYADSLFQSNVQTKPGLIFSEQTVNDDIRRLYDLGFFADVTSSVDDLPDGKKAVTFHVTTKPVVNEIVFEGNEKFPEEKLKECITVAKFAPLRDAELTQTLKNLREFYINEGHNNAKVVPLQLKDGNGIKLVFKIDEALRVRVNDVNFEGVTVYTQSELRDAIETRYTMLSVDWLSWLPLSGGFGLVNPEAIEHDKVRLREMFWRKGLLDFKVTDVKIEPLADNPEKANITFVVEEGEPYFIGNIAVLGPSRFSEEELLQLCPMQKDDMYNVLKDDDYQRIMASKYRPLGYCDLNIRAEKMPNFATHTVDLHYTVVEGQPYSIGEVYISGNKWTKDKVIRRELTVVPGDPVDQNMIDISKNRLMGMGYFEGKRKDDSGVEVVAVKSPEAGKKDIYVNVNEKRFIDGKIGAGWSSDDNLAGMIELTHSNVDILDPKNYFTGGGQRLRIMGLAGLDHMGAEVNFTEPWLFDIPLKFDISGYWREVSYDHWDERRLGFDTSLSKRIFDDFTTLKAGYTFEQVRVHAISHRMTERFQDEGGSELAAKVYLQLSRDTRDSIMDPRSGYYVSAYGSLNSVAVGGRRNYYKVELRGINYMPFFQKLFVLTTGFKIGTMDTFGGTDHVPLYDRYFLGGGDSVRGFSYRSIGPTDRKDDNYGGEFMYVLTAELSHPILEDYGIRGAFFCDIGNATGGSLDLSRPNIGAGWGLRLKLPYCAAPIRLDLAYPVLNNQDGESSKLRFHFNMGFSL